MCNLYLVDLQRINAASISLVLGERGLMLSQTVRSSFVKTGGKKKSKTHLGSDHEGYCYNVFLEICLGFICWHLEIADPFHNLEMG